MLLTCSAWLIVRHHTALTHVLRSTSDSAPEASLNVPAFQAVMVVP